MDSRCKPPGQTVSSGRPGLCVRTRGPLAPCRAHWRRSVRVAAAGARALWVLLLISCTVGGLTVTECYHHSRSLSLLPILPFPLWGWGTRRPKRRPWSILGPSSPASCICGMEGGARRWFLLKSLLHSWARPRPHCLHFLHQRLGAASVPWLSQDWI